MRVLVTLQGRDGALQFEGNSSIGLGNSGELVVTELVEDIANVNDGKPIPRITDIINPNLWEHAMVRPDAKEDD